MERLVKLLGYGVAAEVIGERIALLPECGELRTPFRDQLVFVRLVLVFCHINREQVGSCGILRG